MAVWPVGLPQKINQSGFSNSFPDNTISKKMDTGPDKKRRRDVSAPEPVKGAITVNETEYSTLKTFYNVTLAGGSLPFDWVHPITGDSKEFTFNSPPSVTARSGEYYTVTLDMEILT